jgi:hypothetical protein
MRVRDSNIRYSLRVELGYDSRQDLKIALNKEISQLLAEAKRHELGTVKRQQILTQIVHRIVNSGMLYKNNTVNYEDALQQTLLHLCCNICEAYDPTRGSIITWLNTYLKWRLYDLNYKPSTIYQSSQIINFLDQRVAPPDIPPILENTRIWAETDEEGELSQTHIHKRPDVNVRVLILSRLPAEVSWRKLSTQFELPVSTLSSFYQRQCLPRLRRFAQQEGYL